LERIVLFCNIFLFLILTYIICIACLSILNNITDEKIKELDESNTNMYKQDWDNLHNNCKQFKINQFIKYKNFKQCKQLQQLLISLNHNYIIYDKKLSMIINVKGLVFKNNQYIIVV